MAHNKNKGKKQATKTTTHVVTRNIFITYRMHRQGYLTVEIPEIEIWREQQ